MISRDGSKSVAGYGAEVTFKNKHMHSIKLPDKSFTVRFLRGRNNRPLGDVHNKNIAICVDSQAVSKALNSNTVVGGS